MEIICGVQTTSWVAWVAWVAAVGSMADLASVGGYAAQDEEDPAVWEVC